jgi:hypothetical protein
VEINPNRRSAPERTDAMFQYHGIKEVSKGTVHAA